MAKALSCLMALVISFQMAWAQEERRIEPVVVTATRIPQPLSLVSESVTVITEEEIARSQAKTVADLLRGVPGLDIQRSGSLGKFTSLRVRGAESDQTLVMLDGVQINNPFDQLANLADLTPDNIERIEIIRGGESALYGSEAVGGVVNIITKKGKGRPTPGVTLAGSLTSFREQVTLAGSSRWRWPVDYSLTLSRLDTRGQSRRDGYENSSFSSRLGADLGNRGEVSVILRAGRTENEIPFDFVFDPFTILPDFPFGITRELKDANFSQRDSTFLATVIYKVKPFSWWNIRVQASGQDMKRKADNPFDSILAPNFIKSRLDAGKFVGEIQNDFYISNFLTLTLGYEYKRDHASFFSLDNLGTNFGFGLAQPGLSLMRAQVIDRGLYFQSHLELLERLFLTFGLRYDRLSTFGDTTNFKAAFSYLIKKSATKLKFSWGTQFNAPTIVDLFFPVFGNPLLGPERSESYEAGLEQELFKGKVKLEAVYFHIDFKDRIEFVPDPSSFVPPFGALRNVGRGESEGVEFGASYRPWDFLSLGLNWSYLDTENRARPRQEFARRPRNKLNFLARYDPWERLHLNVAFLALGSQRDEFRFIDARGRLRATSRNPGYNRLDLTVAYDPILEKDRHHIFQKLTLFARAENALDKDYEEVKGFPAPGLSIWGGIKAAF